MPRKNARGLQGNFPIPFFRVEGNTKRGQKKEENDLLCFRFPSAAPTGNGKAHEDHASRLFRSLFCF